MFGSALLFYLFSFSFVVIFNNGVTYSSPVKNASDVTSIEKQVASAAVADHINHKIEPTKLPPENVTHLLVPTAINSTNHPESDDKNKSGNATVVDKKIISPPSTVKNASLSTLTSNNSTTSSTNTTLTPTVNNSISVPEVKTTSDLAPTNFTEMPRPPFPSGQNTSTTVATETTTKAPATKPTVATPTTAVPTSTETIVVEHDSSSKTEEKGGFHGPSFVGGIVLTIGLNVIGFIAFKYYKSGKIDGNYRTL